MASEATMNDNYLKDGAQVNMGGWISKAWDLVFSDIGIILLVTLLYVVIIAVASATVVGEFIVIGPLTVGFFIILYKRLRDKPVQIGDIGKGFNFFAAALLSNILISVFVSIGLVFCIIPGLVIAGLYMLTPAFVADKKMDFWAAMEASRKVTSKFIFEFSVFVIVLGFINFLGAIVCGVGLLVTIPLTIAAQVIAYDELVGWGEIPD